jgi:serine/threonine protein kinase HipA of HipAB toxin-antitoxin module
MADFPDTVFRVPGKHYGFDSRGFDYLGVNNAEELEAALADGWHRTIEAAMGRPAAKAVIVEVQEARAAIDEMSPATRKELEQKARQLGVSFNARTRDEVLAQRIASAL